MSTKCISVRCADCKNLLNCMTVIFPNTPVGNMNLERDCSDFGKDESFEDDREVVEFT